MTDEAIQTEIETLSKVVQASANRQPVVARRDLVPRTASAQRTMPSFATAAQDQNSGLGIQTVASGPSDDEFLFD